MPSSFTSSLGIEKPADGEQDGVWGDIVNANMEILDRTSDGQATLTLTGTSSSFTVTSTNGQKKVLILAGSPSGTHTITLDPNTSPKIYFVRNTTAQSVVFTQGSGGNITVAAGDSAILYSNGVGSGSAVFNLSDHFSMSSVNITGGTASLSTLTATGPVNFSGATVSNGGSVTTVDINGGTIDGASVGASSASTGAFTTGSFTGDVTIADKIIHAGDTDTVIRFPGNDTVTVETSGVERMRINSTGNVGLATLTNVAGTRGPTFTKGYVENVFTLTGTTPALDPANGTIQTWTLTANSTPTDSVAAGESLTLMIDDGTAFSITWPSVVWKTNAGLAPPLNLTGLTAIVLWKVGTVLYGARVGNA
jgi:hypothetical protein